MTSSSANLTPTILNGVPVCLLDTVDKLASATTLLSSQPDPCVAVDLEGENLSRHGRVATVQLCGRGVTTSPTIPGIRVLGAKRETVFIVDIVALGPAAFSPQAGLKALLESPSVTKLFFDVRADANALFHHFGVNMPASSIVDLQLLDICDAVLKGQAKDTVGSLGYLLERSAYAGRLPAAERNRLKMIKAQARELFSPEHGGSYAVWLRRPLHPILFEYATDVCHFHGLRASLRGEENREILLAAVQRRLDLAHGLQFEPNNKAMAPVYRQVDPELLRALRRR